MKLKKKFSIQKFNMFGSIPATVLKQSIAINLPFLTNAINSTFEESKFSDKLSNFSNLVFSRFWRANEIVGNNGKNGDVAQKLCGLWCHSGVLIGKHISHFVLLFLLLTLSR